MIALQKPVCVYIYMSRHRYIHSNSESSMVWKTILPHLGNVFYSQLFSISMLILGKSIVPLALPVKGGMGILLFIRYFEI